MTRRPDHWRLVRQEFASGLGREGLRAAATFAICVVVVLGGTTVMVVTWTRTAVAAVDIPVWVVIAATWLVLWLIAFGSGAALSPRLSGWQIVNGLVDSALVAFVLGLILWVRGLDEWAVRLPAFWVMLLIAVLIAGVLLSAQVGKTWVRTFAACGLLILVLMLVTIGRNERVATSEQLAETEYLQLTEIITNQLDEPTKDKASLTGVRQSIELVYGTQQADKLVFGLCELAGKLKEDCEKDKPGAKRPKRQIEELGSTAQVAAFSCLPGWTLAAFRKWTEEASRDRVVAATSALARCELRAFDPGSSTETTDPSPEVAPDSVESTSESQNPASDERDVEEQVDEAVDEGQVLAAREAQAVVSEAMSVQRSESNLIETLADGADGVLGSISGPTEFAEFRFSGATWLVLLGLVLVWYRFLEIRAGGHGLGPVEISFESGEAQATGTPDGEASGSSENNVAGTDHASQAIFKQAVIQNVPEPGAVPGAQALAPVGDLISSSEVPNKWAAKGVFEAVRTILATRSGYTVLFSSHEEYAPSYGPDGKSSGQKTTAVVFVRIRDTQNGAQKASMRFEAEYVEEAAQMAGYWVAGWIISRSRYVPEWAVWSERDAHAFFDLQWRQGDDLPLRAHGSVDPNRIQASVNALILAQRAYAYQLSPGMSGTAEHGGPYTYNALEDFARAAYHQPRYPVARYRRAVALSSLMQGGLKVEEVFLPPHHLEAEDTGERDRQDTPHRPSETRLLHLFRDLIGFGDEAKLEKWIKKVWESGCFPPEMRSEMLDLADQWFEQARIAVSAGSVAKLRPSERGFWQDFLSTSARDDWTALIEVSQKIVDVRRLCLKYEDPATRDDAPAQAKGTRDTKKPDNESQKNEKDIIKDIQGLEKRARRRDSHWQISYNIACFYSLLSGLTDDHGQRDHGDRAFDWLERCLDRPYSGQLVREWIERDPELDPIRSADPERWERWRRRVPRMPVEIRPGDRSPSVLALQRDLNRLRVRKGSWQSLKEDGYFGEATAQAVRQFQIAKSIPVTGKVDYAMLALLEPRAVGVS